MSYAPVWELVELSWNYHSSHNDQHIIGFPSLKGDFLKKDIRNFNRQRELGNQYQLINFGGYAKVLNALITFYYYLKETTNIPTDPIYTGKLFNLVF